MNLKMLFLPTSLLVLGACGDAAAPATGLSTTLAGVMTTASTQLNAAVPGSATLLQSTKSPTGFKPFADLTESAYNTTNVQIFGSGYFATPKEALQYILNKAEDTNPEDGMGLIARFKQKIINGMCPIVALHPDADNNGIPDVGSGTITLPDFTSETVIASLQEKCADLDTTGLAGASGRVIGYAVTDVSGETGSQYSIKSTISFSNNGTNDNVFYFKADGSVIRFAFAEVNSEEEESSGAATLFEYDGTNLKFDYYSGGQDGHYRMLYNTSTKDVNLYAWLENSATQSLYMGVSGNRAKSVGAYSLTAVVEGTTVINNGQACVDLDSAAKTFSAAPTAGTCDSSAVIDFATAPAVVAKSQAMSISEENFTSSVKPLFSTAAQVFSVGIITE